MALRRDLPTIPQQQEPTIWNGEMAKWGYISLSGAELATTVLLPRTDIASQFALNHGAMAIGGLLGGQHGKERMAEQQITGKIVRDPTIWNTSFFTNSLLVSVPASALSTALFINGQSIRGATIAIVGGIGSIGAGIAGGFAKKERMQDEFNQAMARRDELLVAKAVSMVDKLAERAGQQSTDHGR